MIDKEPEFPLVEIREKGYVYWRDRKQLEKEREDSVDRD